MKKKAERIGFKKGKISPIFLPLLSIWTGKSFRFFRSKIQQNSKTILTLFVKLAKLCWLKNSEAFLLNIPNI